MHKRALHIVISGILVLMISALSSCSRPADCVDSKAVLSVVIKPSDTKSGNTEQTTQETRINSLEIFVFDMSSSEKPAGSLDGYAKASTSELLAKTVDIDVSTGLKHIYAIANGPEGLEERVHCEEDLLSETMRLGDNRRDSFVMVGSPSGETNLVAGVSSKNKVHIELRRLVCRVKVGTIRADFISPAFWNSDVQLRRVFITDVTSSVNLVNGDVYDVFGTPVQDKEYTMAGQSYKAATFYLFESSPELINPCILTTFPDGSTGVVLDDDASARSLTSVDISAEEGMLCSSGKEGSAPALPGGVFSVEGGLMLYAYPNCRDFTEKEDGSVDGHPTMLVLEVSLQGTMMYYSFNLGYLQPNYSYTVSNIRLRRSGEADPRYQATSTSASCTITVADWLSGEVVSGYGTTVNDGEIDFR